MPGIPPYHDIPVQQKNPWGIYPISGTPRQQVLTPPPEAKRKPDLGLGMIAVAGLAIGLPDGRRLQGVEGASGGRA